MKKRTTHFLVVSLIVMIFVSIGSLALFAVTMSDKSEDTIMEIGTIYMSGMSEKTSMNFRTTINLRMAQIETIVKDFPPEEAVYGEKLLEDIERDGKIREFEYLAFYTEDDEMEMIYGSQVTPIDTEPFGASLRAGDKKVSVALNEEGEKVLLMGLPTAYPMADGTKSVALVAGLPSEYIDQTLELGNTGDSFTRFHMIRNDGICVIHNEDNYFDKLKNVISDSKDHKQYVSELKKAMEKDDDYTTKVTIDGELCHMYCTSLPYSEWYLVSLMSYDSFDQPIEDLGHTRITMFVTSLCIILIVLIGIFLKYFSLTQKQIKELDDTRRLAIEANKAKSEFLSNMSHDIRTPMNAIMGLTAIASSNVNNPQLVSSYLEKITLSSKHLLGLINDVLDMSKIESGKMTLNVDRISLREVMDSIVNIIQSQIKAKRQHFDVIIENIETENVYCDSVRLNQILLNLLSNAVKFTPEGGSIRINLSEGPSPKGDGYVRIYITVKDTGIGMTQEYQQEIFDPFSREDNKRVQKTEGTGLGMAITKYIVDAMKGTIEVKSDLGEGTEFHVVLDMEKAEIREEDMCLPNWNMLVVDDDEQVCKGVIMALKSIGINAESVQSGELALKMIEEKHLRNEDYQVILLDWKLPGIDGIETARRIGELISENIPILLISAYDWSDIENDAHQAGICGFISKPLFKSTLYHGLKQFAEDHEQKNEDHEDAKNSFGGAKVLVAEDNDLNWEIANELLSQLDLKLDRAENGKECVDMLVSSPEGYYAAILMDLRMPIMTGYEAAEAIRKLERADADIPIIAMTADAFSEDIQRTLRYGMNAHVAKPINISELSRLLKKYIK